MLLDFRKPAVYVLEKYVSHSGRYLIFYGSHYHAGHICWVFGTSSKVNGEIIMRHYNSTTCMAPKAVCGSEWRKFREAMLRKPESEETDETKIPFPWQKDTN